MDLSYQVKGAGKLIVFLHGFGFNHLIWDDLTESLKEKYCCVLVDLPGFGNSDYYSYSLDSISDDIVNLPPLANNRFWLCGWSLGGLVAMATALSVPSRVLGLINLATNPSFVAGPCWPGIEKDVLMEFYKNLIKDYPKTIKTFLFIQFKQGGCDTGLFRKLVEVILKYPPCEPALEHSIELLAQTQFHLKLNQLACPSLWVYGEEDALVPAKVSAAMTEKNIPNILSVLIENAAHLPFITHKNAILDTMRSFIDD